MIPYPQVRVYWNLHKKCFSIQDAKTRRVMGHAANVWLADVTFKVSEAGRQRVLKEKKKNVHAFVCGKLIARSSEDDDTMFISLDEYFDMIPSEVVTYNPYEGDSFRVWHSTQTLQRSDSTLLMRMFDKPFIRTEMLGLT